MKQLIIFAACLTTVSSAYTQDTESSPAIYEVATGVDNGKLMRFVGFSPMFGGAQDYSTTTEFCAVNKDAVDKYSDAVSGFCYPSLSMCENMTVGSQECVSKTKGRKERDDSFPPGIFIN